MTRHVETYASVGTSEISDPGIEDGVIDEQALSEDHDGPFAAVSVGVGRAVHFHLVSVPTIIGIESSSQQE